MDPAKYEIIEYFIDKQGKWSPRAIRPEPGAHPEIDVVFPVLHGTFGEDGTVQGLLELADLPYVGAGVLASSVSMDKEMMKRVCMERMLPVVDYVTVTREKPDLEGVCAHLPFPMFVKPANLGSSVGISKAHDGRNWRRRWRWPRNTTARCRRARHRGPGAGVRGAGQRTADGFPALRNSALARILRLRRQVPAGPRRKPKLPADLPPEKTEEVRRLAVECYRAVECEGMARVDFLLEDATGKMYINEINTIPGFTSISMYPKMWEPSGSAFRRSSTG